MRNSRIILVKNIEIDRDYRNVVDYNNEQMLNLCEANKVEEASDYSFIRNNRNRISVGFNYSNCLNSNYIAFQNPDYSNKWFFAWIDEVTYISDKATEITFTIDAWSTWFGYWNLAESLVIREHVNDDTIGLHTFPEKLETGEYVTQGIEKYTDLDIMKYVLQVTEWAPGEGAIPDNQGLTDFGGVPSSGNTYIFDSPQEMNAKVLEYQEGKADAIINAYMVPASIIDDTVVEGKNYYLGQKAPVVKDFTIDKPILLDGYRPINNKLLTFPYTFLVLDNNNGMSNILQYENFSDTDFVTFEVAGVPTVGASIKCYPTYYKNASEYQEEGLISGKFPTLSWASDPYTNWLSQNAINLGVGIGSSVLQFIAGGATTIMTGGAMGLGTMLNSAMSFFETAGQVYQHEMVPKTASGNTNGGDINTCSGNNTFFFIKKCIKNEYAKIIDDFFTRFGYKVNRLKKPNITGRPIFNYIQIASSEDIGYGSVPTTFMETINNACRNGITIWHNHANIGRYDLDNTIQQ